MTDDASGWANLSGCRAGSRAFGKAACTWRQTPPALHRKADHDQDLSQGSRRDLKRRIARAGPAGPGAIERGHSGENWVFPVDMTPRWVPRYIDVSISDVYPDEGAASGKRNPIHGVLGIHMVCETATGAHRLAPFGNAPNRILDLPRDRATVNAYTLLSDGRGTRRFVYGKGCSNDGRVVIQIQSNLKQRGRIKSRDVSYGYVNTVIPLKELPPRGNYTFIAHGE